MSNPLTGDYEAALQIAIRQVNGLLGTLHQNGATPNAALQLLHSTTLRIADQLPPPGTTGVFADWVTKYQRATPGHGLRDIQAELTTAAPPGAARMLTEAFDNLYENWLNIPPPGTLTVGGLAKLQVSTPTITVPDGSSSEITVNSNIRAAYYPDPGTTNLPAPVHGDVQAAFEVTLRWSLLHRFERRLFISPSSDDSKFLFTAAPGTGLSASDQDTLAALIRQVIRQNLTLLPIDIPRTFPFTAFKGLSSGSSQVMALPFQLSGAAAPASGVQPLNQVFIGSSGFAVAVSKEYVTGLIDLAAIRAAINSQSVTFTLSGPWGIGSVSVTYQFSFTSGPTLTFLSGSIQISGQVAAQTSSWWAPNGSVSFTQSIVLVLDVPSQTVTLAALGDPNVNQSWFIPHDYAVNIVKTQINNALTANTPSVRNVFTNAKNALVKGFNTFDPAASVSYTQVEITPDGVIVRGEIGSEPRLAPMVNVAETNQSTAFTAFESWIPAGRIDRFIWSWVEHSYFNPWSGIEKSYTDEHRFIFPKPADATQLSQICLQIEGTQTLPGGQEVNVVGGTTCSVGGTGLEFGIDAPSWWGPMALPIWQPGLQDTTVLRNAIIGHVSIQANVPAKEPLARNVLVYFADWRSHAPLASLETALSEVKNVSTLMVIVVLPAGVFDATRHEVENKLSSGREWRAMPQYTEDDESGWTHMFAVTKRPSVYFINARREFVWKHEGEPNPAELAAAIDRLLVPTSAPQFRPLRLTVALGDRVPDVSFETDGRDQFSLRRLRGRDILLNFWQSWSAPCLTELSRLQRLYSSQDETPFVVGFHGGKNSNEIDQIRKRLGLSFPLVQDSQQRIARQYGVRCWPTTILVGADGRTQHIQFGIGHEETGRH
jgi:peroxiredoxin